VVLFSHGILDVLLVTYTYCYSFRPKTKSPPKHGWIKNSKNEGIPIKNTAVWKVDITVGHRRYSKPVMGLPLVERSERLIRLCFEKCWILVCRPIPATTLGNR
jgi:hypothetical protein